MKVRLLGTAAGGGAPQWNCACVQCVRSRVAGGGRTQDCVAVSGDGQAWHLLNASPDVRSQLLAAPELAPQPPRRTPLRGVLLTDAELDHTLGLLSLREASALTVYATATVLAALDEAFPLRALLGAYAPVAWQELAGEPVELAGGLAVTAIPLGDKRPRYAAQPADVDGWAAALRVRDTTTGSVLVYAPCLARWDTAFDAALVGADCLLLDGTFATADELPARAGAGTTTTQAAMGHLPMADSLPHLAGHPGLRVIYTHLNNTNPVLSGDSLQAALVQAAGAEVGADGMLLHLSPHLSQPPAERFPHDEPRPQAGGSPRRRAVAGGRPADHAGVGGADAV
jgi:pyrroloquinoline quinone biosynthesis protein B